MTRRPWGRRGPARVAGWMLMPLLASAVARADEPAFYWRTDVEAALAQARSEGRSAWLQFTGPWCVHCRRMEAQVFPLEPVAQLARSRFVPIQVRTDAREDLAAAYGVSSLPTTIVIGPDGTIRGRVQGFVEPASFLAFLESSAPAEPPALGGACPVTLVETGKVEAGSAEVTERFDGRLYQFRDEAARGRFLADPVRFVPARGGLCAVGLTEQGARGRGGR